MPLADQFYLSHLKLGEKIVTLSLQISFKVSWKAAGKQVVLLKDGKWKPSEGAAQQHSVLEEQRALS